MLERLVVGGFLYGIGKFFETKPTPSHTMAELEREWSFDGQVEQAQKVRLNTLKYMLCDRCAYYDILKVVFPPEMHSLNEDAYKDALKNTGLSVPELITWLANIWLPKSYVGEDCLGTFLYRYNGKVQWCMYNRGSNKTDDIFDLYCNKAFLIPLCRKNEFINHPDYSIPENSYVTSNLYYFDVDADELMNRFTYEEHCRMLDIVFGEGWREIEDRAFAIQKVEFRPVVDVSKWGKRKRKKFREDMIAGKVDPSIAYVDADGKLYRVNK